jgi:hypothetical protein
MPGNSHLKAVLNQCAYAASRARDAPFKGWYWSLHRRIGSNKATVALSRKILTICYTLLRTGEVFNPEYCLTDRQRSRSAVMHAPVPADMVGAATPTIS